MQRKVACAIAVALMVGGAGCGGEEKVTKAAFIKEANSTCDQTRQDTQALKPPNIEKEDHSAVVAFGTKILDNDSAMINKLGDMGVPPELDDRFQRYLTLLEQQNRMAREIMEQGGEDWNGAIAVGSPLEKLSKQRDAVLHEAVPIAQEIGLTDCGI